VAVYCIVLYCVVLCCIMLCCVVLCCVDRYSCGFTGNQKEKRNGGGWMVLMCDVQYWGEFMGWRWRRRKRF